MPKARMDHFTVLTKDAIATAAFYSFVLGLESGPRPNLNVPGVWLYSEGKPIMHVIEKDEIPGTTGVLDCVAFWLTDLSGLIAKLEARNIPYELRRVPEGGPAAGVWQLFFCDSNSARIEINLAASEALPEHAQARVRSY